MYTVLLSLTHLVSDSHISDAFHALPPHGGNVAHFFRLINNNILNAACVLLL